MSQVYDVQTVVQNSDVNITNTSSLAFGGTVDASKCIGGSIQVFYSYSTAPIAGKNLDIHLLVGMASTGPFDDYSDASGLHPGTIIPKSTSGARYNSILLPPINAPFFKVCIHNNGTGQTVTIKKVTVNLRKVG